MSLTDISIIDVGHGNSSVLHSNNQTIIIDCGSKGAGLLQYLEERNITEIKTVYLSHADQDHIGGLLTLLLSENIKVHEVMLNSDGSKHTKIWDDLITILDFRGREGDIKFEVSIHSELLPVVLGELTLNTVGPSKYLVAKGVGNNDRKTRKITSNSISASFTVSYNEKPIIFLSGDIDQIGLDEILYTGFHVTSEHLVFPHHGGKIEEGDVLEFTKMLISVVAPKSVIFSVGRKKFNNPRPEIIKAVKESSADVRIACTQLSGTCSKELPAENGIHLHGYYSKGRHTMECCSGTLVLDCKDGKVEIANHKTHQDFISVAALTAMCRS